MNASSLENILSNLKQLGTDLSRMPKLKELQNHLRSLTVPKFEWPALTIGDLHVPVPIVQGGMGVAVSLSGLASAVAEAGGVGVIAANAIGMIEKDYFKDGRAANLRAFRKEIRAARAKTDGVIGVNIMVAVNDFHELLDVAIEEKVDLVFMGAGLPIKDLPVEKMRENGVKAVPIVSSARAVEMIFRMWKKIYNTVPDALVFEGPMAGGHLGFTAEQLDDPEYQLEAIVPQIVEAVKPYEEEFGRKIPVIAGGGVYSGDDIHRVLSLGASAVQMGTRFVATEECDADEAFKQAYVDCTEEQIGLIKSPVGMPGRAIRNDFITSAEEGTLPSFKCAWQCLGSCKAEAANYCISVALNNARRGKLKHGFVFSGSNAYRVTEIVPVATLFNELTEGYRLAAREGLTQNLEAVVRRIQELRAQYDSIVAKTRRLAESRDWAMARIIRDAGEAGAAHLKRSYYALFESMQNLQTQIADTIAETLKMLDPYEGKTV